MNLPLRGRGGGVGWGEVPGNRAETLASPFLLHPGELEKSQIGQFCECVRERRGPKTSEDPVGYAVGRMGVTPLPFAPLEALLAAQWLPQGCLWSCLPGCSVSPVPNLGVCIPAS